MSTVDLDSLIQDLIDWNYGTVYKGYDREELTETPEADTREHIAKIVATLKAELLDKMPKERPDATKQGELIPFNGKNAVEMHWLRKCQDAGYNDALDDVTKIVNEL